MRKFLLLLLTLSSISYADVYTVAVYPWEPFVGNNHKDKGILIEIIRQAMQSQGHDIKPVNMPWSRALISLKNGSVDIIPGVWFTRERAKTMIYSQPVATNRLVFIKVKGDPYEFQGLNSLKGKAISTIRDYAYGEEFLAFDDAYFSKTNSLLLNVRKLIMGRADLTIGDEIVAKTTIPSELLQKISFTKNALSEKPLHITCGKGNQQCQAIIKHFNNGLNLMNQNGSLEQILNTKNKATEAALLEGL